MIEPRERLLAMVDELVDAGAAAIGIGGALVRAGPEQRRAIVRAVAEATGPS